MKIDNDDIFSGYAWGQNISWITFNCEHLFGLPVTACKVGNNNLALLAEFWLGFCDETNNFCQGTGLAVLAKYWLDYYPETDIYNN